MPKEIEGLSHLQMRMVSQSKIKIWDVVLRAVGTLPACLASTHWVPGALQVLTLEGALRKHVLLNECLQKASSGN